MRSAGPIASLLASLGLHACAVLLFVIAARQPVDHTPNPGDRLDAWQGNGALEVDAIAAPEAEPNVANAASVEEQAAPDNANERAPEAPAPPSTPVPDPEAVEPPRPKPAPRRRKPRPAVAAAAESTGRHEVSTPGATGAFGSADLPPGVRSLPSAFTRAIPPATGADPVWQRLPVGTQPAFVLAVRVDAEGHISSAQVVGQPDPSRVPEQVAHFRERVIALLGGGLFALQNNGTAGTDLFRVTITLSDRAVKEESEPAELVERGFEPPRGGKPGRAHFTLASGRHFEAKVEVLGAPLRPSSGASAPAPLK